MQQLRMGLPRRAAGRHDGASLRVPSRRSGANTSEAGRNPDAAAKYLLWKNYPAISDANGRLRRRKAASLVPRILHSERTLAETGRSCALSAGDSLPALTMAGWPYTLMALDDGEMEDENMDKDRFAELFGQMRKDLQDNDCSQYSEEARQWATEKGIVLGGGTLEDGEPNYMWQDMMTREQFVTVLYRFAKLAGLA